MHRFPNAEAVTFAHTAAAHTRANRPCHSGACAAASAHGPTRDPTGARTASAPGSTAAGRDTGTGAAGDSSRAGPGALRHAG